MSIRAAEMSKFLFDDIADPRVKDWLFMENPSYVIGLTLVYLYLIYIHLPRYMEKRKPYELKRFIQCYNIFQVTACSLLVYRTIKVTWKGWATFGCYPMDYSENVWAVQLAGLFWWNMMIKGFEFIETIVFALRKKNNQISVLHVYHHVSTFLMGWLSTKYAPGGMLMITIFLNSAVHVLMYTYYFLASLGPNMQKKLNPVKSKLTLIQVSQLIFLFFHAIQAFSPSCDITLAYPIIYMPVLAGDILLFFKFYYKSYIKQKRQ